MASQSLCGWSSSSPTSSTVNPSSSSSLCRPFIFFAFHPTPSKRHRFSFRASFLRDSSSSTRAATFKQGGRKSIRFDCPCSSSKSDANSVNRSAKQTKPSLSFKTLSAKRSLWRRIFFASKKVRSIILLNVVTLVYASSIPVVKEVEAIVDPASFTVVRFALSAIPFIPFVLLSVSQKDVDTRNSGVELGFWVSLGYLMQAVGLLTSDAGRASFLSMLTVIVVPLLDGMLGAVVPARTWFAAFMAIIGVAMLESSGSPPCVGDLLNFLSALFFGVHMIRTEHIARSTKKDKFLALLGYQVCVVSILSTTFYLVGGWSGGLQEYDPSLWSWTNFWNWMVAFPWIPAIYTGLFSSGLCLWGEVFYLLSILRKQINLKDFGSELIFLLAPSKCSVSNRNFYVQMAAMRDVSATETAIIYALEPVWGGGFAWFLLGERWGTAGWVGAALVLGGSLSVQILGSFSSSSSKSGEDEKLDMAQHSDKRKGLSASPIIVSSRKNVSDLLK
ncbi:hypothetical protein G4B88_012387 [Cannabis sativa]|uniref:EamA domain-containing protein n=1 Tax=Cannabis sativa TaxID=3483 RepID=A0A7J6I4S4_CANSA|nr:hypothetical protein G4B88_012387 [Cannabis sativa]